jgi:uncharacterized protein YndB with AHSA1/START domain
MKPLLALLAASLAASPAAADVVSAAPGGFEVRSRAVVAAAPAEAWAMLGRIGQWWSPDHTYSGSAANLRLKAKAGGCFCETLAAGGSVEHGRVLTAMPGKLLVLDAALGPVQSHGAAGRLSWSLRAVDGGTELTQTYIAGGYFRSSAEALAPLVDKVMAEQLGRLQARLAKGR